MESRPATRSKTDSSDDATQTHEHAQEHNDPITKVDAGSSKVKDEPQDTGPQRPPLNRFTTSHENVLHQFFIGAIDQGTTSSRFIIFDGVGVPVAMHQVEFKQMYPHSG